MNYLFIPQRLRKSSGNRHYLFRIISSYLIPRLKVSLIANLKSQRKDGISKTCFKSFRIDITELTNFRF